MQPSLFTRVLLLVFPRTFRERHGRALAQTLRTHSRTSSGRLSIARAMTASIDLLRAGLAERWAQRVARPHTVAAGHRPIRGPIMMHSLFADIRAAFRVLRQRPGFTSVAVVTLALGIGANTAIFTAVHAVLMRPLPYPQADRIVAVYGTFSRFDLTRGVESAVDVEYWRQHATSIQTLAAMAQGTATITGGGEPAPIRFDRVEPTFFDVMGTQPSLGRAFSTDETRADEHVAVISQRLWRARFGGDVDVTTRTVTLDGEPWRVVGVMPAGFAFPTDIDIWRPFDLARAQRNMYYLGAIARLKPGVTLAAARSEMDVLASQLEAASPKLRKGRGFELHTLREEFSYRVADGLRLLQGVTTLVLLIACANVANLMLAQAADRRREFGIRAAVGASRARLVRQLLTESVVLAGTGAAAGVALAFWGVRALVAAVPPLLLTDPDAIHLDWSALVFTALVAAGTGVLFGLAPAWTSASPALASALAAGTRTVSVGLSWTRRQGLRAVFVAVQVALAVVLLVGSGLLIRSFVALSAQSLGFDPAHLITAQLSLPAARYPTPAARQEFWTSLLDRLRAVPGVTTAVGSTALPFSHWEWQSDFVVKGREAVPNNGAGIRHVSADYFPALGIPILKGRGLTAADTSASDPVAVVSDVFVAKHMPGLDPVGQQISFDSRHPRWLTIVGVAGSTRHMGLDEDLRAEMYAPISQDDARSTLLIALKTPLDPVTLDPAIRAVVKALDPDLPVVNVKTMGELVAGTVAKRRLLMMLLTLFAGLAATLAAIGVYGVMAFVVTRGSREIGIRLALGARPWQVQRRMLAQGLRVVAVGAAAGVLASAWLGRLLTTQLFAVKAQDPATIAIAAVGLIGAAALACWVPSRRAARIDPAETLRQ